MKQILTLVTTCIIICVVFASCKSNMSITKRHYNNGYYIAHSKGKQVVKPSKEDENTVQTKTRKSLYSIQDPDQQNNLSESLEPIPTAKAKLITKNNQAPAKKAISKSGLEKSVSHKVLSIRPFVAPIARILPKTKQVVASSDDDDGLSLFWIIILIILLLWVLGFLGGYLFGGLIHLLLIIALILLILWLLHII